MGLPESLSLASLCSAHVVFVWPICEALTQDSFYRMVQRAFPKKNTQMLLPGADD
jgi:hypothetical protein